MILRRNQRRAPGLNTTSTSDISFILLVFFLVITSMDVDKGLERYLPPKDSDNKVEAVDVAKRNVMSLSITASGVLLEDGRPIKVDDLRSEVVDFVGKKSDRSRHMITLDVDRHAPYGQYFNVQNEIVAAYGILRNRYTRKKYGKDYDRCNEEQRKDARKFYPQRITETSSDCEEGGAA